jgi:acetolactate synthase-1/2/3 large subunit
MFGMAQTMTATGVGTGSGMKITEVEQMDAALERAFAEDRPYLLEIVVDRDAKCSMSPDGSLHTINYYTE